MFIAETRTFWFQNVFAHSEKPLNCSARVQKSIVLDEQFFSAASAKELSFIFFAGTDDRNPSILIIIWYTVTYYIVKRRFLIQKRSNIFLQHG